MNLSLINDAATEPISLADAKAFLVLSGAQDDALVSAMIKTARLQGEAATGRELNKKTWLLTLDRFPTGQIAELVTINYAGGFVRQLGWQASRSLITLLDPLVSVQFVRYRDPSGIWTTLVENTDYVVDRRKHPGIVCPMFGITWPAVDLWPSSAVEIEFTAGYEDGACPADYITAMKLLVSQYFEARIPFEGLRFVAEPPFSVSWLFGADKTWKF